MRGYARILLLGLTLTASASAADEIEFEIVPAIVTAPLEPVAGAPLTVRLEPDLISRGRSLRLVNADTGLAVAEQRIAGDAIDRYTFQLPDDLERLAIELLEGEVLLLRSPSEGAEHVWGPSKALAANPDQGLTGSGEPTSAEPCSALAPDTDEGPAALSAWLDHCPLDHASLPRRDLTGVDLSGRVLRRADLREADLSDARIASADLSGASLFGARLDGADLSGANLEIADLSHASLFVADLGGANLRGADLRSANLADANMANTDLTGARLEGANLDATDFSGAICPNGYRTEKRCDAHLQLP